MICSALDTGCVIIPIRSHTVIRANWGWSCWWCFNGPLALPRQILKSSWGYATRASRRDKPATRGPIAWKKSLTVFKRRVCHYRSVVTLLKHICESTSIKPSSKSLVMIHTSKHSRTENSEYVAVHIGLVFSPIFSSEKSLGSVKSIYF